MFFRIKRSGNREYVQIVENKWLNGKVRQKVLATVGRYEQLIESGSLKSLIDSGARVCGSVNSSISFDESVEALSSHQVSRLLSVSPSTVVTWIDQGKLPGHRTPGGHRRVLMADLKRFIEREKLPLPPVFKGPEQTRRIFVIDDEPRVIRAIQRVFAMHGGPYEVQGCTDGIEALVLIGAQQPDLVLLDIYMAGLDGFEVCRRLKQIPHLEGLTIVAMSAHPTEEARQRILEYGARAYLHKPISAEQVIQLIEEQTEAVA